MNKKQAVNPFLPSYEYIPDSEPYVFNGRVYIYGSHDRFNGTDYCMNDYVCWSADVENLGNWCYEGIIYHKSQDPMSADINPNSVLNDRFLFAPDVQVGPDGKYYLFYSLDFSGVIAVAVSDSPCGNFQFVGNIKYADGTLLGLKAQDPFQFDPAVFIDDDGRVFLYTGFCPEGFPWHIFGKSKQKIQGGMVTELEPDMVTVKNEPNAILPYIGNSQGTGFEGHEFFEAASMRKINGIYYYIYSSINGHELCYATSIRPDGDFFFGGTIISNADIFLEGRNEEEALNYSGNNHGSIVEINGQWFVFYHRQTNKHQYSRQACAEPIIISKNGNIHQVEMTSSGMNIKPLHGIGTYEARIACNLFSKHGAMRYEFGTEVPDHHPFFTQDGEDRNSNPNQYIANMTDGSVAGFKYFSLSTTNNIQVKAKGFGKGTLSIFSSLEHLNSAIEPTAVIPVELSDEYCVYSATICKKFDDVSALYFKYTGDGSMDFHSFNLL